MLPFLRTGAVEIKINDFHDKVIDAAAIFRRAVKVFLENDKSEVKSINSQIRKVEHEADILRRDIENRLFVENLIPNLQAEILQLVESLDRIINRLDSVVYKIYVENPEVPENLNHNLIELSKQVADAAEYMAIASRAFFKDFSIVRDYSHKVYIAEQESDGTYNALKKTIFESSMPLANKMQLDLLISEMAEIADLAEDCADELAIICLKRDA